MQFNNATLKGVVGATLTAGAFGVLVGVPLFALVGLATGLLITFIRSEVRDEPLQYAALGCCMALGLNIFALLVGVAIPMNSILSILILAVSGAVMGIAYRQLAGPN